MIMSADQSLEIIPVEALLERVRAQHQQGSRLVQIGATRLPDKVELTYSFDLAGQLSSLRLQLPTDQPRVPSISPIYWCAFLYENDIHDLFNIQVDGIVVDFKGTLYRTAVKYPFGSTKVPAPKAAPAPAAGTSK